MKYLALLLCLTGCATNPTLDRLDRINFDAHYARPAGGCMGHAVAAEHLLAGVYPTYLLGSYAPFMGTIQHVTVVAHTPEGDFVLDNNGASMATDRPTVYTLEDFKSMMSYTWELTPQQIAAVHRGGGA